MSAERGLRGQMLGGVAWSFAASLGGRIVSLASLLILARLLLPEHFGIVAAVLAYVTYVEAVADLGTAAALVYWPRETERAAQTVLLVNLVTGSFWLAVTWLIAPWLSAFFHQPAAEPMFRVAAFGFPLRALGVTHDALAIKGLRFRARVVPATGLPFAKAVVSMTLAWLGWEAWSLVWGHLAGLAFWSALLWFVVPFRPRPSLSRDVLGGLLRYGRGIVAVNVLAVVVHHADLVVVGRVLGSTALGLYQMAFKLPDMSLVLLMRCVSEVLFPAFSRLQESRAALGRAYAEGFELVALLALPCSAGIAILAEPLVNTLLGPSWAPSIPILQVLAIYAGIRSVGTHAGDVLKATGRSGLLARLALLRAVIVVPALWVGSRFGLVGVAVAMAASAAIGTWISIEAAVRVLALSRLDLVRRLRPGAATAIVASLLLASWMVSSGNAPAVLRLLVGTGLGGLVLLGGVAVTSPALVLAVWPRRGTGARGPASSRVARLGRFVLPVDQPSVLAFLRRDLATPSGWLERLGVLGIRRRSGVAAESRAAGPPRGGPWGTRCIDALRTDGAAAVHEFFDSLPGELVQAIGPWDRERWILRRSDPPAEREQHLLFLFDPEGDSPSAVLKVRPCDGCDEARPLRHEAETLGRLRAELPEPLRSSLPSPRAHAELERAEALLLDHVDGRSAYAELRRAPWRSDWTARHFAGAARWLAGFHGATTSTRIAAAEAWALAVARIERTAGGLPALPPRLAEREVPVCATHGDFWAGNLLLRRGRRREGAAAPPASSVWVVDWEHPAMAGSPFDDLFHFPLSYALSVSSGSDHAQAVALRRAFLLPTSLSRRVRGYFAAYCAETGIDAELLAPFFLLHLEASPLRLRLRAGGAGSAAWRDLCSATRAGTTAVFVGARDPRHARATSGALEVHP